MSNIELLQECKLQLEYLNQKFTATGTTNSLLAKIEAALQNKVSDVNAEKILDKHYEYLPIELFDLAFESWANKQNWQLHSSNEYYYRSKNMHSWPPDETIEIADLKKQFMKYISIVNERKEPFGYVCNNMFFKDISGKTFIADEDKPIAVYVDKSNDNIPTDFKQVTGHDSPKEMMAYEKGREDEQQVIIEWIEKWDGSSNSVMGALLKKKFDERKDSGAIEFAEWLRKNNMSHNGFGGWGGGKINVNFYGSKTTDLYKLFQESQTQKK